MLTSPPSSTTTSATIAQSAERKTLSRSPFSPPPQPGNSTTNSPRFSIALHGAAELLGVMLLEGVERSDIDSALGRLLDDIEARIAEDQVMGGPPKGNA